MFITARRVSTVLALVCVLGVVGCDSGDGDPSAPDSDPAGRQVVAVIGDSYMAGFGVANANQGMAVVMANRLGMDLVNLAVGSTGYINGGLSQTQSYPVQASSAIAAHPSLYLVEGALNDWAAIYKYGMSDLGAFATAAKELYARLVAEAGADNVIVVGPIWPTDEAPPQIYDIDRVLQRETELAGVDYIDPLAESWITPSNNDQYIGPDGLHPNVLGHQYIARRLADAIEELR
jgi:lysophospholipase L1-like esterase